MKEEEYEREQDFNNLSVEELRADLRIVTSINSNMRSSLNEISKLLDSGFYYKIALAHKIAKKYT